MKKIIRIIALIAVFALVVSILSNYIVKTSASGKLYVSIEEIPHNKVGLVLGTSPYLKSGYPNHYFTYRIEATIELYRADKIDFILVSGDNGSVYYDEPSEFKKKLIEGGIPENKIYLDYAGFRTLDSVVRAKEIFGQESFTLISQAFHNERAVYLAEKHNIDAIGFNAKDVMIKKGFKTQLREYFARTKAVIDINLGIQPKFLGEKIKIT